MQSPGAACQPRCSERSLALITKVSSAMDSEAGHNLERYFIAVVGPVPVFSNSHDRLLDIR